MSGSHTDVGGGAHPDGFPMSLSYIPLRWMIQECHRTSTGIKFDPDVLCQIGFPADPTFFEDRESHKDQVESEIMPRYDADLRDITVECKKGMGLYAWCLWWLSEAGLPMGKYQVEDGVWWRRLE